MLYVFSCASPYYVLICWILEVICEIRGALMSSVTILEECKILILLSGGERGHCLFEWTA